jgi:hypothetical protein
VKSIGLVFGLTCVLAGQPHPAAANGTAASSRAQFAGAAACVSCHPAQSKSYLLNSMRNALQRAGKSDILLSNPLLSFSEGVYRTVIQRDGPGSTLTVTDGKDTISAQILWAFGLGSAGQTYVFEYQGETYESRVSFYSALKALDLTMGAQLSKPATLTEAIGRRMDKADVRDCFGCHSTAGVRKGGVDWEALIPGISCEGCHGPAADHVEAQNKGGKGKALLRPLETLSAEETNELCGSCHRTWAQVAQMNLRGPLNVRFQPYRITNSKCFDSEDRRIACTACHDAHSAVEKTPAAYDSKCLSCHSRTSSTTAVAAKSRKVCHTAMKECVSCHMPKVRLAGSHFDFADHQIRIARPGDPYPN